MFSQYIQTINTGKNEVLLWTEKGQLQGLILPQQTAYFYHNQDVEWHRINLEDDLQVPENVISLYRATSTNIQAKISPCIGIIDVLPQHLALLMIDEEETRVLPTGIHYFWQIHKKLDYVIYDLRLQFTELNGQELVTADKMTVRINATSQWQISDALLWHRTYQNGEENFYRELQFAVRAVVGSKTIDDLLSEKSKLDDELSNVLREKKIQGINIKSVGIKDVILPGEVREILSRVVEAEKTAQANNIRRRE